MTSACMQCSSGDYQLNPRSLIGGRRRAGGAVAGVREAEVEEAVAVVFMDGGGGYCGVGQHRGGVGYDLVPADVDR